MNGRKITRQLLSLVAATIVMQGCALAPGMKAQNTEEARIEEENVIAITSVTTDLLKQMEAERRNRAEYLASELSEPHVSYLVGPGDVLNITVWDHPELTLPAGQFRDAETSGQLVDEDGYFFYPYVGNVRADGMTVAELRDFFDCKTQYVHQ